MNKQKLEEEYPYLDNIWRAYQDYDKSVNQQDDPYQFYHNKITYPDKNPKYTDISVKLLRNLIKLSDSTYIPPKKIEYCIYLYHWIYYRTKESGIGALLLSIIYTAFEDKKLTGKINICPYILYKNISSESDEIIKLNIFNNNISAIRNILMDEDKSKDCRFQKFIHSCVNIYKKKNKRYCQTVSDVNETTQNICSIVNEFGSGYTSYIFNERDKIKIDLPPLSSTEGEDNTGTIHIAGCSSNENQEESNSINNNQPDSTALHNVPKILGTMAGISSFIAMSYKFTPFRKFFQLRRGAASLSNSLNEKEPINLINNESDTRNVSSNNTKYNIGYGSV